MVKISTGLPRSLKPWVRLVILIAGLIVLCTVSYCINGTIFPADSENANIFQGGLLLVILGSLFLEDKFTRPADAVVNALTGMIALITVYPSQAGTSWALIFCYCLLVFLAGVVCIALGVPGESLGKRAQLSHTLYALATTLGRSRLLFSFVFLYSVLAFYGLQSWQTGILVLFWGLYVVIWPLKLPHLLQALLDRSRVPSRVGSILRMETPDIVLVEMTPDAKWDSSAKIVVCTGDGQQRPVFPLFKRVQDTTLVGTGLCLEPCEALVHRAQRGEVYTLDRGQEDASEDLGAQFRLPEDASPIGLVSENSKIGRINFETWCPEHCREGLMVFCDINKQRVFYQIVEGNTRQETLASNRHGFQVAEAAQLGTIDGRKGFRKYPWLPEINTAVFAAGEQLDTPLVEPDEFIIGRVPGSTFGVAASIEDMLTYHTAILGVTGTGKTELAYDLVREAVARDIKVFCVDLTGLYGSRLSDLGPQELSIDESTADDLGKKLLAVETGQYGAPGEKKSLEEFKGPLQQDIQARVEEFLGSDTDHIGLFSLPSISNTKTTIFATELYMSSIFRYAREHPEGSPILVVLEEAHTVVPESSTMGLGDFGSKAMVAKIAQIALQGRKFGVGLLVIAQRTATVSKTVLTQCNTMISFSCYDQTSLDFLTNFVGRDSAYLVPNLEFLQAVMFGKGIRSERPLIVEIPFAEEKQRPEKGHPDDSPFREIDEEPPISLDEPPPEVQEDTGDWDDGHLVKVEEPPAWEEHPDMIEEPPPEEDPALVDGAVPW